jgi:putative addiction module component (TIGR02574 family)
MAVLTRNEIDALSPDERLSLIGDLWESLGAPPLDPVIEARHREIVESRLAAYDETNDNLLTLDEVHSRLRKR